MHPGKLQRYVPEATDGHEGIVEGVREAIEAEVVVVEAEGVLRYHISSKGRECLTNFADTAGLLKALETLTEDIQLLLYFRLEGENCAPGEHVVQWDAAGLVQGWVACGEDRARVAEAAGHPFVLAGLVMLSVQCLPEWRVLDVDLEGRDADDGALKGSVRDGSCSHVNTYHIVDVGPQCGRRICHSARSHSMLRTIW